MTPAIARQYEQLPLSKKEDFSERAAIMQHDGGMTEEQAELAAMMIVAGNNAHGARMRKLRDALK